MRDVHEGVVESRRPCIRRAAEVPVNGREVRKLVRKTPNIYITGVSTLVFTLDVLSTCHRDVHGSLMNVSSRTCWMCLDAMVDGVQAGWLILATTVDGSEEMASSAGHVPETGFATPGSRPGIFLPHSAIRSGILYTISPLSLSTLGMISSYEFSSPRCIFSLASGGLSLNTLQTASLRFDMSPTVADWGPIHAAHGV